MIIRCRCSWLAAAVVGASSALPALGGAVVVRNQTPEAPASAPSAAWPVHYPRSLRHATVEAGTPEALLRRVLNLHMASRYEEALAVADELCLATPGQAIAHYNRACVLARLRRSEAALDAIDRAIELGWRNRTHLTVDPDLDCLRDHPRFRAAVDRAGTPMRSDSEVIAELENLVPTLLGASVPAVTVGLVRDGALQWQHRFDVSATSAPTRLSMPTDLLLLIAAKRLGIDPAPSTPRRDPGDAIATAFAVDHDGWRETLRQRVTDRAGMTFEDYCRDHILAPVAKGLVLVPVGVSAGVTARAAGPFRVAGSADGLGYLVALAAREGALGAHMGPLRHESTVNGCLVHWSAAGGNAVIVLFPPGAGAVAQRIATVAIGH